MPISDNEKSGDGINAAAIDITVTLPDSGTTAQVDYTLQEVGLTSVAWSGTVTLPAPPGSGTTYYNFQVDPYLGGAPNVVTSPTGQPAAGASSGVMPMVIMYSNAVNAATTDPATQETTDAEPDSW